ncbi:DHS-like NAD/FAD-binding domain-containing protein [Truncatella angustata]|uniref:DHS-like NAD/FAD-binding domain-containing protein n=1 Tax=Truncatella angustata TaxID=152316 RepID=A0A9P8UHV8_9PEZI|nr:DHS-like NAD/FAD-binding domain-containing protein [Truncatella angustata]KAH6652415.1 DHS-like NAD/FAD-binding domain-containing protein [Truncatella angustata]
MAATPSGLDSASVVSFQKHLATSTRIVAILGAGLSASSGLPTFRSADGLWCSHDVQMIATPAGWRRDPGLVWQFYSERRRKALRAQPNSAHYALTELAKIKPGFVALSQNVDGLLQRAGMGEGDPKGQLKLLHGNLFDLRCASGCGYEERGNFDDPLSPGDDAPKVSDSAPVLKSGIEESELPQCPSCKSGLLRPGVVWFGEGLPQDVMDEVDALFDEEKIDLCLVIGTSSLVWPAAGFAEQARNKGARIATVNMNINDAKNVRKGDWVFIGDAAVVVPEILGLTQLRG